MHRDFNFHHETMLTKALVLLTYLNRDWKPEYCGALELWDGERNQRIKKVEPVFGRSILFRHSDRSFHGHPTPLAPPPGRTRRWLASYYYMNDQAKYAVSPGKARSFLLTCTFAGNPSLTGRGTSLPSCERLVLRKVSNTSRGV